MSVDANKRQHYTLASRCLVLVSQQEVVQGWAERLHSFVVQRNKRRAVLKMHQPMEVRKVAYSRERVAVGHDDAELFVIVEMGVQLLELTQPDHKMLVDGQRLLCLPFGTPLHGVSDLDSRHDG